MRKVLLSIGVAIVLAAGAVGCGSSGSPTPGKKYACPMNCVTSDSPGKCPKCGMEMR